MSYDRSTFLRAAGTALAAAGGLALPVRAAAQGAGATTIRFGYQATVWGAPAMVAEDLGIWAKYGAKVQSLRLTSGAEVRDGLLSGSLDAGSIGATPFIIGAANGNLVAVAIGAYTGKTLAVVVGKDSKYKTVADLRGAKFATALGTTTNEIFMDKIAPKFGLHKGDLNVINMVHEDMPQALETHQIDAFAGVEPYPSLAVYDGYGRILIDYGAFDISPLFLVFRTPFVAAHQPDVLAALRAWLEVGRLFAHDRAKVDQTLYDDFTGHGASIPLPVIASAVGKEDVTAQFRPAIVPYLHGQAQVLIKQGAIASEPDWSKVLRTDLLAEAEKNG